ncbi:zinc-binding dehydrogenase [Virgibacillus byunsanensis]|uniref:Zinc-binding dehydrogenase n=1 Tax=Virgibacillus byunsanensis TaxID=570945 RepID=A0ABW3LGA3_9BACI
MKALFYTGPNQLNIKEIPVPTLNEREVLIKVAYVGICGTDMLCYHGGMDNRVQPPVILGHEFSGIIEAIGANCISQVGEKVTVEPIVSCGECSGCKKGEYNLCSSLNLMGIDSNGAISNLMKVSEDYVYSLGDKVSMKDGALVEPIAVCIHLLEKVELKENQTVLIVGGGPIGLITAQVAKKWGANVVISEINEFRIRTAQQLGFSVINPVKQNIVDEVLNLTNGSGFEITVEATGTNAGLVSCIEAAGVRGKVVIAGLPKKQASIDTYKIIAKELQLIGTRVYKGKDYRKAINLLASNDFETDKLISRIVSLEDSIEYGFKAIDRQEEVIKIFISLEERNL